MHDILKWQQNSESKRLKVNKPVKTEENKTKTEGGKIRIKIQKLGRAWVSKYISGKNTIACTAADNTIHRFGFFDFCTSVGVNNCKKAPVINGKLVKIPAATSL